MPLSFADATAAAIPLHMLDEHSVGDWISAQDTATQTWANACGFAGALGQILVCPGADGIALAAIGYGTAHARVRGQAALVGTKAQRSAGGGAACGACYGMRCGPMGRLPLAAAASGGRAGASSMRKAKRTVAYSTVNWGSRARAAAPSAITLSQRPHHPLDRDARPNSEHTFGQLSRFQLAAAAVVVLRALAAVGGGFDGRGADAAARL